MPSDTQLQGAAGDLGLGSLLGQQVKQETDEERKKRLAAMQRTGGGLAAASLLPGMSVPGA